MKATIITIGDEILIGQITDTNSAYIASRLNDAGIAVDSILSVGDSAAAIRSAIGTSMAVSQLVIITGGLGPTKDDITKSVLADYFGCGMREDRESFLAIESMMKARGIDFNALNRAQAVLPEACTALPNPNGTAPGMWFERDGKILVSLPGVPFEMEALLNSEVMPRLKALCGEVEALHRTMTIYGIAESVLAEKIEAWEDALPEWLHLAYLPGTSGIRLRLSAYGRDAANAESQIESGFKELEQLIPDNFLGYGDTTLAGAVAAMLQQTGETLAVAESCTGGYISHLFTSMPGASDYFMMGAVTYSNRSKTDVLGVPADVIEKHGAVSEQVARLMAEGARKVAGTDYAIATTGVAGPTGGTPQKPVGTVWIAVSHNGGTEARLFRFGNLRRQNIERAASSAIDMLRRTILAK